MGNATSQLLSKLDLKKYTDTTSTYISQNMTTTMSQDAYIVQSTKLEHVKYYGCDLVVTQSGDILTQQVITNDAEKNKQLINKLISVLETDESAKSLLFDLVKRDQKKYDENVDIVKTYLTSKASIDTLTQSIQSVAIGQTIDVSNVIVDVCGELLYKKYDIPGKPPCPTGIKCPLGNEATIKIAATQIVQSFIQILKGINLKLDPALPPRTVTPEKPPPDKPPTPIDYTWVFVMAFIVVFLLLAILLFK